MIKRDGRMRSKLTPAESRAGWHKARPKKRARLKLHLELLPLETRVCLTLPGNSWMASVPDNTSLYQMSLPGTHDSMTGSATITPADAEGFFDSYFDDSLYASLAALFTTPIVQEIAQTQTLDLTDQLNEGVRVLDIRVQEDDNQFEIVHGSLPIGTPPLMFDTDVLQPVSLWLAQNPTEAVVMSVQVDSQGSGNTLTADQVFKNYESECFTANPPDQEPYSSFIYQATTTEPMPATLGAARGRIAIIQNNWAEWGPDEGPNAGTTADPDPNFPDSSIWSEANFSEVSPPTNPVNSQQNDYTTADLNTKWQEAMTQFALADKNIPLQPGAVGTLSGFYSNYLTASDPGAVLSNTRTWAFPRYMATGDTEWVGFTAPSDFSDFLGDIVDPASLVLHSSSTDGMNAMAENYIDDHPGPTGIVMTDFAPESLIQAIYANNPTIPTADNTLTLPVGGDAAEAQTISIGATASGGLQETDGSVTQSFALGQIEEIDVLDSTGSDTIDIQSVPAGVRYINVVGQGSATTLETPSGSVNVWHNTGVGSGTLDIGATLGIVTYSGVANEEGGGGTDTFKFEGGSVPGYVDDPAGVATLDYSALSGAVDVDLLTQAATDIGTTFMNITNFIGDAIPGSTITAPGGTWTISGPDIESVSSYSFSSFPNVVAAGGPARFVFEPAPTLFGLFNIGPAGGVSGYLEGAPGFSNTLDYSEYTDGVAVNLQEDAATYIASFSNISNFIGGSASDNQILSPDAAVMITGRNAESVDGDTFSSFGNLVGGTDPAQFAFEPGGSVSGSIDGGGGGASIDYSALVGVVEVDALTQTATGIGTNFMNITNFIGDANLRSTITARPGLCYIVGPDVESFSGASFSSFPNVVVSGGPGYFVFEPAGSVSGNLQAASGFTNTLDYSDRTDRVDVDLQTVEASGIGGTFSNITNVIGSANPASTITVPGNVWAITGPDAETDLVFSLLSFPNVVAAGGPADFVFEPAGSVSGNLQAASGFTNTLDYSDRTDRVNVDTQTDEASDIGGTFSNITNLIGSANPASTITVPGDVWAITGPDAETDLVFSLLSFPNVVAAGGPADFVFEPAGSISGNLQGASGFTNTLDYSERTDRVNVDTQTDEASDIGGTFSNISNFIGGSNSADSNNALVGTVMITGPNAESVDGDLFSSFGNLEGAAQFAFEPGGSVSGSIDGGLGSTLDYSALAGVVDVDLIAQTAPDIGVTFSNISSFIGGSNSYNTIYGPDATWMITGPNAESVDGAAFSSFGNLVGVTGSNQFVFEPGGSVSGNIDGGGSTSTLDYSALTSGATVNLATDTASDIGGKFTSISKFIGSSGNNTLFLRSQTTCEITGSNTSAIYSQNFTAFENLVGAAYDQFVFNPGGRLSGSVTGMGGNNVVSYENLSTAVTVNLAADTAQGIGGTFSGISKFFGGREADTLVGPNSATSWAIPGVNTINVLGLAFSNFPNIRAGSGNDSFAISGAGELTGNIDGGGGVNSLSYSGYPGNVIVDLLLDGATAVLGGVHDIQNVTGGNGNNLLVGTTQANVLVGGSGRNILIGEGGGDSLTGGGADNILIGGSTIWDGNLTALQAIFAVWNRPDLSFSERVSLLSGNGPKRTALLGNYFLNASTALTDNAVDALYGGAPPAADWFIVTDRADTVAEHNSDDQITEL